MFKVIVAGCGNMSETWIRYALERKDVKIAGLVDVNIENALLRKKKFDLDVNVYNDIDLALRNCDANMVFNVTVPEAHRKVVVSSLENKCHVLGEKPMASSPEDAKEMLDVSLRTGYTYGIMQNRRYNDEIYNCRKIIDSGVIGKPGFICADFFLGPKFGGFRDIMDSPLILDMAIHTFDQARYISGKDPVSVYCKEFNPPGSWYRGDACAVCIFEMTDGTIFSYRGSWCALGGKTSWESDWRICCEKGALLWDGDKFPVIDSQAPYKYEFSHIYKERKGHFACLDHMIEAVKNNSRPDTSCYDNIYSMAMVFAAIKSSKTGNKVFIKEFL